MPTLKKPKELLFANARIKTELNTENRNPKLKKKRILKDLKTTEKIWS
jgi:hypothetical protein